MGYISLSTIWSALFSRHESRRTIVFMTNVGYFGMACSRKLDASPRDFSDLGSKRRSSLSPIGRFLLPTSFSSEDRGMVGCFFFGA